MYLPSNGKLGNKNCVVRGSNNAILGVPPPPSTIYLSTLDFLFHLDLLVDLDFFSFRLLLSSIILVHEYPVGMANGSDCCAGPRCCCCLLPELAWLWLILRLSHADDEDDDEDDVEEDEVSD